MKLKWDDTGARLYETGVRRVFFMFRLRMAPILRVLPGMV